MLILNIKVIQIYFKPFLASLGLVSQDTPPRDRRKLLGYEKPLVVSSFQLKSPLFFLASPDLVPPPNIGLRSLGKL